MPTGSRSATTPPLPDGLVGAGVDFVGDAIADPLTGLAATYAVLDSLGRGGGEIVEIALAEVAPTMRRCRSPWTEQPTAARIPRLPRVPAATSEPTTSACAS